MPRIIRFLQSESFIFLAILCVLFAQVLHTAAVFRRVSRFQTTVWPDVFTDGLSWLHALLSALAIEGAILMFIINGKKGASKLYALGSFACNLLYYHHWKTNSEALLASTLISAMLSGSIWYFSDLFVERLAGKPPMRAEEKMAAFICPECGKTYASEQQLRGHLSGHARKSKRPEKVNGHSPDEFPEVRAEVPLP